MNGEVFGYHPSPTIQAPYAATPRVHDLVCYSLPLRQLFGEVIRSYSSRPFQPLEQELAR